MVSSREPDELELWLEVDDVDDVVLVVVDVVVPEEALDALVVCGLGATGWATFAGGSWEIVGGPDESG